MALAGIVLGFIGMKREPGKKGVRGTAIIIGFLPLLFLFLVMTITGGL